MRDIAKMRRQLAEEAAAIAEAHRDDVWQKVQARLWGATPEAPEAPATPEKPRRRLSLPRRKKAVEPPVLYGSTLRTQSRALTTTRRLMA